MTFKPEQARIRHAARPCDALSRGWFLCALAAVLVSGCATTPNYPIDNSRPVAGDRDRNDRRGDNAAEDEQLRTSSEKNNDWGDAFTAPLEDFNMRRQDIPVILADAVQKPYDMTGLDNCNAIATEVIKLDALLGLDYDEPPPPKDARTTQEKGRDFANEQAVGAVRGATRSMIPFRDAIRYLSGADKHRKQLDNAIQAGKVRRAYLKGVGMNKNCAPPAAPSWFRPRVYVETYVQPSKPVPAAKPPAPKQRTTQKRR